LAILLQDIRFALRQLWKHPGFSLAAIFSLTLGISTTVAVFSLIYTVLLHPTPYRAADRIVRFVDINDKNETEYAPSIYREQIRELRDARSIEEVVEMDERYLADTTLDVPQDVDVVFLSGNTFPFFGVPAMLGRTFLPSDDPEGQAPQPVAVLTYQYWQRRFNGNPAIVGQSLRLDNRSYTVLGVMPRSFNWWDSDLYLPLDTSDASMRAFMTAMRLKPGISKAQAMAEIDPILEQMIHEHPHSMLEGMNLQLLSTSDRYRRSLGRTLYVLFAGVLLLLVIGCLNVSILLLARAATRQQEFAVRAALGASRQRIIRQLITEALILGFAGTLLGIVVSYFITPLTVSMLPWQLFTHGLTIPVQAPVLAFAGALALITSVVFGFFPALQFSKPEITAVMKANSRSPAGNLFGQQLHAILIAGQIALAMVLLTAAFAAIASFRALERIDLGYDPNHLADFGIPVHSGSFATWEARSNYFRQLRDRVAQVPGVLSASLGVIGPPSSDWDFQIEILDRGTLPSRMSNVNFVDSEFFRSLRIPLLQGRLWDEAESGRGARLAIVNDAFLKRYFPNADVLGHSVRVPDLLNRPPAAFAVNGSDQWAPIIGVVGNARNDGLNSSAKPEIYFPYSFYMINFMQVFVRTRGDPMALETAVRRQVARVNPGQQVSDPVLSMTKRIEQESEWAHEHLIAVLSSTFSVLALLLGSVGLYSIVSYSVTQRVTEFGIRMALGAQRRHILQDALATVAVMAGSGFLLGLLLSLGVQRLLSHWIENAVVNWMLVMSACLLLIAIAFLACLLPAIRATMIRPNNALRVE
jgi:predicted permease